MYKIRTNRGEVFEAQEESLLQILQKHSIYLPASCGGKGVCGRCKIKIIEGKTKTSSFFGLSENEKKLGYALACQTYPESDIFIEVPERLITVTERISSAKLWLIERVFKENASLFDPLVKKAKLEITPPTVDHPEADLENIRKALNKNLSISRRLVSILPEFLRKNNWQINIAFTENEIIDFLEKDTKIYAVSVDIGTTTVALALIDLEEGKILEIASCYNSQINYGDDVITRIIYAVENKNGLEILRKCIVEDINALINTVSLKHKEGKILYVTVSSNTTMAHIFWGINPKYIRQEPYTPALNHYPVWNASQAKLLLQPDVPVYTVPSVAGYVGGDIVAGILSSGMYLQEEISLFIDIGTNGEVVIGNNQWLVTASTSAGPCFEGSGISCGMRATSGAVESFSYDKNIDSFKIRVIGDVEPRGICGTGMIDIVSELFSKGIIDQKGRFIKGNSKWIKKINDEEGFIISAHCYITQSDIDNIIRAKAAIYAGISTLLEEVGISEREISKVYIAGGFGEFLDIKKAIKIGMLPNLPEERFQFLGNTSLAGAILCALSYKLKEKVEEIADKMTYIDLSRSKKFMDEYISALFLPHTDWERFRELG
ncbi:MAG: ASKHA domain-containing protein [Thermodesulfovibrio sp.]|nr:ASKHA domain-containing protein [Thermodesulfovibrio sp.]